MPAHDWRSLLAALLAGCQTAEHRATTPEPFTVTFTKTTGGWLAYRLEICLQAPGASPECEEQNMHGAVTAAKEMIEAGYEVPGFSSRTECEQGYTMRMSMGGITLVGRTRDVGCQYVNGVLTNGRGWRGALSKNAKFEMCTKSKGCANASLSSIPGVHAMLQQAFEAMGGKLTYSSKTSCEQSTKEMLSRLPKLLGDKELAAELQSFTIEGLSCVKG